MVCKREGCPFNLPPLILNSYKILESIIFSVAKVAYKAGAVCDIREVNGSRYHINSKDEINYFWVISGEKTKS